ncbi:MAG TPA: ribonuclease HI [Thermohalobaculum sp.]|nr:ribonuclease HI [Thermohalobaculum sp.]
MAAEIFAYTDGACSGNPGPGGWGVVMEAWEGTTLLKARDLGGGEPETTNNRMEMMAAIAALEILERPSAVTVVTDSKYLMDGITGWINAWKRNGWKTAAKKPVKNVDLWQRLDAAQARHQVKWAWIKGHAGHEQNERADELARAEIKALKEANLPADSNIQSPP